MKIDRSRENAVKTVNKIAIEESENLHIRELARELVSIGFENQFETENRRNSILKIVELLKDVEKEV